MDGIRLRSLHNTGAFGDIILGGVGFKFAVFRLIGHSNFFHFTIDSFENYTSSLITTTVPPPIPEFVFKEWGTVNEASRILL
jgi:hypothetical protein